MKQLEKRILALLLSLAMACSLLSGVTLTAAANTTDSAGDDAATSIVQTAAAVYPKLRPCTEPSLGSFDTDEDGNYLIRDTNDWNSLSELLAGGADTSGAVFLQTADFTVSVMLGSNEHPFKGVYDGGGHTLTLAMEDTSTSVAPFKIVAGATIRRLKVDGTVKGGTHSAGLISGISGGPIQIRDVLVAAEINSNATHAGGFIGHAGNANYTVSLEGCVFAGSITGSVSNAGVFIGWSDSVTVSLFNCLDASDTRWYFGMGKTGNGGLMVNNCYYLNPNKQDGNWGDGSWQWPDELHGKLAYAVTPGEDVTLALSGVDHTYPAASLAAAEWKAGLQRGNTVYAGEGESVSVELGYTGTETDMGFMASAGTLTGDANPYTLTMPAQNVTISTIPAVPYLHPTEGEKTCAVYTVLTDQTVLSDGWYVVNADTEINNRITVTGNVHIILCDSATLTANAGVNVAGDNSLTIWAQSDATVEDNHAGALIATANSFENAGIGGNGHENGGTVNVYGGTVTATGGEGAAGIGGGYGYGYGGDGGTITLVRSRVTANGGDGGAGIGGGVYGDGGTITLVRSRVTANGGDCGAGIGGGEYGDGGTITIRGGTVNATGGEGAAGIGGGFGSGKGGSGGKITITDCELTAQGGDLGAGIGGGEYGDGGEVTITGGTVIAIGGSNAAGVGGGYGLKNGGDGGTITITGCELTATGGGNGAGIGGGQNGDGGEISITGSTVTATGGEQAAGVGGGFGSGKGGSGGKITITDSELTAAGGEQAAGIGGGVFGVGREITITGSTVTATGGEKGAGIGSGYLYNKGVDGGKITITGSTVTAIAGSDAQAIGHGYQSTDESELNIPGMKVTDPAGVTATGRKDACRGSSVKLEKCGPHQDSDGNHVCDLCGDYFGPATYLDPTEPDEHGDPTVRTCTDYTAITEQTTLTTGWYVAGPGTITTDTRITVNGDVNLILCDGATLTAKAGVNVSPGNSLTIWAQSDATLENSSAGKLIATGIDGKNAGIGGNVNQTGGTITINGGKIDASCSVSGDETHTAGAGIGGGEGGSGGTITINGGKIDASCSVSGEYTVASGAGIGGGSNGSGGTITINGGKIDASCSVSGDKTHVTGAGIGGGQSGSGGTITINGGDITASCSASGESAFTRSAGIGGGQHGSGGTTTINGGTVNASCFASGYNASAHGAGIGGSAFGDGGTITINGGKIGASCSVSGDNTTALGAGIGGGNHGSGGTITINGGDITASCFAKGNVRSDAYGAGIGGGIYGTDGTITINGGTVNAASGSNNAQAIGCGYGNNVPGELKIPGMKVTSPAGVTADRRKDACRGSSVTLEKCGPHQDSDGNHVCDLCRDPLFGPVTYLDPTDPDEHGDPTVRTCTDYTALTEQTALTSGWYVVGVDTQINERIAVIGEAHLILMDGATLTAKAGVSVPEGNSLTVWGQTNGTGTLYAGTDGTKDENDDYVVTCNENMAAIGGEGSINVNGGSVTATGGEWGAGIGGCLNEDGGVINIKGGTVKAVGGDASAGIGGGYMGAGGTITISGGDVTAVGCDYGAGIGGGCIGNGGDVTIEGGTVRAVGGASTIASYNGCGAGIGGGSWASGGRIVITGGVVTASAEQGAQAIGCGDDNDDYYNFYSEPPLSGDLIIPGMKVTDPAGVTEGRRETACRGENVTLEVCDPHDWGDWTATTAPTCTETGEDSHACVWCGKTETRIADALGHDLVHHDAKAPTCTAIGWAAYDTCSRCDFTTYKELSSLGHDLVHHDAKAPTCTAIGWEAYDTCSRCDYTTYKELAAIGHAYALTGWSWTEDNTQAEATFTCGNDPGHVERVAAAITREYFGASCDAPGSIRYSAAAEFEGKTYTDTKTVELDVLGHDWGEPAYEWSADDSAVTARAVCRKDPSHVLEEQVKTNFILTRPSTFDTKGEGYYIVSFQNAIFQPQRKDMIIPEVACKGGDACPSKHFTDMPPVTSFSHVPIDWAVVNHVTSGMTATTFKPGGVCTRGQFVTFLWRTVGQPEPTRTDNPFTDVKEGAFYYKAVLWAVENGITTGTSPTTFSPGSNCNRGQVVTFLWRVEGSEEPASTQTVFTDVKPGAFYYKAMLWAVEKGVTTGMSDVSFGPGGNCTRAQVVTFLYRQFGQD